MFILRILKLWFIKKSLFFYPSELVPDLLGHYVIVCGKSVYEIVVLSRVHKLQSRTKYIGTQQKFTNFVISTPVPPISILKSGKVWKKKSFKINTEFRRGGRECGRRNLLNFCVCSIYFVWDCVEIWECRLRKLLMFWFLHFMFSYMKQYWLLRESNKRVQCRGNV